MTRPATRDRLFSVAEYHRMSDKGILKPDERTELVDGHIISMAAKKPPHSIVNQLAGDYLKQVLSGQAVVRTQEPVHLNAKSEPEPDIAVVQLPLTRYTDHHPYPEEVFLLIEVADTTLNFDRKRKAVSYARAGIADYWVIDVKGEQVFVFREPGAKTYQQETVCDRDATLTLLAFPDVPVKVQNFFPNGTAMASLKYLQQ